MHVLHVQVPSPLGFSKLGAGAFAPKLKPPAGGAGRPAGLKPPLPDDVEFELEGAATGLPPKEKPPEGGAGGPELAPKLNPPAGGAGMPFDAIDEAVAPGRGASQISHFSFALSGFFSMQVLHVHSLPLALEVEAAGADGLAPKLNPPVGTDGGAGGPDGAADFAPGLGASQIVHCSFALSGFLSMQVLHVHSLPADFAGAAGVAAGLEPKLKPPLGTDGGAGGPDEAVDLAPGLGASQIVHCSFALSGFLSIQVLHVHSLPPLAGLAAEDAGAEDLAPKVKPPLGAEGGAGALEPEPELEPKLKPPLGTDGGAGGPDGAAALAPGLGASQMVHFSVAVLGFMSMQVSHFHSPPDLAAGAAGVAAVGFAPNENPPDGTEGGAGGPEGAAVFAPGRGASQMVHFSFAESGFFSMHSEHSHSLPCAGAGTSGVGCRRGADFDGGVRRDKGRLLLRPTKVNSSRGRLRASSLTASLGLDRTAGIVKVKKGSALFSMSRAESLADRKMAEGLNELLGLRMAGAAGMFEGMLISADGGASLTGSGLKTGAGFGLAAEMIRSVTLVSGGGFGVSGFDRDEPRVEDESEGVGRGLNGSGSSMVDGLMTGMVLRAPSDALEEAGASFEIAGVVGRVAKSSSTSSRSSRSGVADAVDALGL